MDHRVMIWFLYHTTTGIPGHEIKALLHSFWLLFNKGFVLVFVHF